MNKFLKSRVHKLRKSETLQDIPRDFYSYRSEFKYFGVSKHLFTMSQVSKYSLDPVVRSSIAQNFGRLISSLRKDDEVDQFLRDF